MLTIGITLQPEVWVCRCVFNVQTLLQESTFIVRYGAAALTVSYPSCALDNYSRSGLSCTGAQTLSDEQAGCEVKALLRQPALKLVQSFVRQTSERLHPSFIDDTDCFQGRRNVCSQTVLGQESLDDRSAAIALAIAGSCTHATLRRGGRAEVAVGRDEMVDEVTKGLTWSCREELEP